MTRSLGKESVGEAPAGRVSSGSGDRRRPAPPELVGHLPEQPLREILIDLVVGELGFDAPIPADRELAQRFGLSTSEVGTAVDELVGQGRLRRVPGRGTFVDRPGVVVPLRPTSFTEDMRRRGLTPGGIDLSRRTEPASATVAAPLGLRPGDPVHVIERLRTADGSPIAVERAHLPARLAPDLLDEPLTDRSLYELLERRYGVVPDSGEQTVGAELAGPAEAQLLGVGVGSPVLVVTRLSSAAGTPVEYVLSIYRADRYRLRAALGHAPGAQLRHGR